MVSRETGEEPAAGEAAPATRSPALRLSVFYAASFLIVGIQLPFWPVWLAGKGLGVQQIATVFAAALWAKVAVTPAIGGARRPARAPPGGDDRAGRDRLRRVCRAVDRVGVLGGAVAQPRRRSLRNRR